MGTRADFYIGRGEKAEWLGSIAWDGYPEGIVQDTERHLFDSTTPEEFKERLAQFFADRDDVTLPENGWPWPWEDSCTTDFAYAFDDGKVWTSRFGGNWFDPHGEQEQSGVHGKTAVFPNMKDRTNVRLDKGSGLIIFGL